MWCGIVGKKQFNLQSVQSNVSLKNKVRMYKWNISDSCSYFKKIKIYNIYPYRHHTYTYYLIYIYIYTNKTKNGTVHWPMRASCRMSPQLALVACRTKPYVCLKNKMISLSELLSGQNNLCRKMLKTVWKVSTPAATNIYLALLPPSLIIFSLQSNKWKDWIV